LGQKQLEQFESEAFGSLNGLNLIAQFQFTANAKRIRYLEGYLSTSLDIADGSLLRNEKHQ
jgi:hypothetical protein